MTYDDLDGVENTETGADLRPFDRDQYRMETGKITLGELAAIKLNSADTTKDERHRGIHPLFVALSRDIPRMHNN
jgi:hypothetical protein